MANPTASFNLTIPSTGQQSMGTSMLAHYVLSKASAGKAAYSGGGAPAQADTSTTPDFSPPAVQQFPVVRQPSPGMSTGEKVAIAGGVLALLAVVYFVTKK